MFAEIPEVLGQKFSSKRSEKLLISTNHKTFDAVDESEISRCSINLINETYVESLRDEISYYILRMHALIPFVITILNVSKASDAIGIWKRI